MTDKEFRKWTRRYALATGFPLEVATAIAVDIRNDATQNGWSVEEQLASAMALARPPGLWSRFLMWLERCGGWG